jgi:phospholipase A1/A2
MNRPLKFSRLLPLAASMGLAASLFLVTQPAAATPAWLIATPDETAHAEAPITLDVVKPAAQKDWPDVIKLKLIVTGKVQEVELTAVGPVTADDTRRSYRGILPANLTGMVRIELAGVESNRLALVMNDTDAIAQIRAPADNAMRPASRPGGTSNVFLPPNEPALSTNEPIYFVIGGSGGITSRFQLSLKYRIFDADSRPVAWFPLLAGLHLGYTQTSIWDIGTRSAPFRDTSYRPSLFWQGATNGKGLMPDLLRTGYEHESNGKDGENSRSINTLFVQPAWSIGFSDGRTLTFAPKVYGYLDKADNPDIQRYRGYVDWNFRYGREDGWLLTTKLRRGTAGHGSTQLDLSYPLRQPLFARTGGFLHFQLFNGYGETMLDYDQNRGTQARIGFSIVR